jgi:hypothetical protein
MHHFSLKSNFRHLTLSFRPVIVVDFRVDIKCEPLQDFSVF